MSTISRNLGSLKINPIDQQHQIDISNAPQDQPPRLLPMNLPSQDLLHGRRGEFNTICIPLYNASTTDDLEVVRVILDKHPEFVRFSITESYETTLHIAVLGKSFRIVQYLMGLMTKEDMELRNVNGETALGLAARVGKVVIAMILVDNNRGLVDIPNSQGRMPLHVAALFGCSDMVRYLYYTSQEMSGGFWTHQNRSWVLEACVENDLFDITLVMVTSYPELAINRSVLRLLALNPIALVSDDYSSRHRVINRIKAVFHLQEEPPKVETAAIIFLRVILEEIMKLPKTEVDDIIRGPPDETEKDECLRKETQEELQLLMTTLEKVDEKATTKKEYSSQLLFLAAEMGNTEFIAQVIGRYPHLALEVNNSNQSIFHVAVSYRYKGIFNLLHEKGHIKHLIATLEDKNGNNIYHLAGERANGRNMKGLGLKFSREHLWFQEVWRIVPRHLRFKKNKAGLTPYEVFFKNHEDQFSDKEKWMKEISVQLMVVAALVATISFAAIFTFPGGYNQDTGIPIFLGKTLSKIFIILDSLSFISSTSAILMVLSILNSDYNALAVMMSLPRHLRICLALIFFSIATIILTFLINLFLLYHNNSIWVPIIFSILATIPYLVFAIRQYRLLGERW